MSAQGVYIAQSRWDPDWLLTFEARPSMEDLQRATKGNAGKWGDWIVFKHSVRATAAGTGRRKRAKRMLAEGPFA